MDVRLATQRPLALAAGGIVLLEQVEMRFQFGRLVAVTVAQIVLAGCQAGTPGLERRQLRTTLQERIQLQMRAYWMPQYASIIVIRDTAGRVIIM
jgi:hypothetical protein